MFKFCTALLFIFTLLGQTLPIDGVNQFMQAQDHKSSSDEHQDCNSSDNISIQEIEHPKFIMDHHFDSLLDQFSFIDKDSFTLRNEYFKFAKFLQVPLQPPNLTATYTV